MTYEVKPLTEQDRSWVINVACKKMMQQDLKRPELYHAKHLNLMFNNVLQNKAGWVGWKDGKRVACICGVVVDHFLCPGRKILIESIWYVLPQHRKGRIGLLLLKTFSEEGVKLADEGTFNLPPTSPVTDRTMERFGWKVAERQFNFVR